MPPAAVVHVVFFLILVVENKLVDGLSAVHNVTNQRMAERIDVWAFGTVGHSDTDAANLALMYVVCTKKQIILAVRRQYGRCPKCTSQPRNVFLLENALMLRPVDKVARGKCIEVQLLVVRSAVGWENPVLPVQHCALGVGIPTAEDGVSTGLLLCFASCSEAKDNGENENAFHCYSVFAM